MHSRTLPPLCVLSLLLATACGGGGSGPTPPLCTRTCTKSDDCCSTPPCNKGEEALECTGGVCKVVGCRSDADCKGSSSYATTCRQLTVFGKTYGACAAFCSSDSDCPSLAGIKLRCVMESSQLPGIRTCGLGCSVDAECQKYLAALKCVGGRYCGLPEEDLWCKTDADCAKKSAEKVCDPFTGVCTCASDQACIDAKGKNYVCSNQY